MATTRATSNAWLRSVTLLRNKVPSFDEHPFNVPAIALLDTLELNPKVTFLVGENGSGKSTLLEAIAVATGFNAEGGSRNFNFSTTRWQSGLDRCLRITRGTSRPKDGFFLRAESYFNVATEVDRLGVADAYGGTPPHQQSHGESILSLLMDRLRGQGLYLLDEPEAALSPQRQVAMLRRMHDLVEQRSQFIIATHSPIIMAYPGATVLWFSADGICETTYADTEHYLVTRDFLVNPQRSLRVLFEEDGDSPTQR